MIYKYIGAHSPEEYIKILDYFIRDGLIMASNPNTFNDPSEFKVIYRFDADEQLIMRHYYSANPGKTTDDYEQWLNFFDDKYKEFVRESTRQQLLNVAGVICFTPESENYLMWSHYAKSHSGLCIGFDDEILNSIDKWQVKGPVNYSDSLPEYNIFTQGKDEFYKATFLNKSKSWEYENEYRIVTDKQEPKQFNKELIKEVIIGCKANYKLEAYVRKYINSNISVFKMIDLPSSYELKKMRIKENVYF